MPSQVVTERSDTGRQPVVCAPGFTGRSGELAALTAALSGPPAVVLVDGEAGIGKSRLVAEYLADDRIKAGRAADGGRAALAGRSRRLSSLMVPQLNRNRIPPGLPGRGRRKSMHTSWPCRTSMPHSSRASR